MKKLLLLISILFCFCACTSIENEYEVTIVYTIDGAMKTETRLLHVPERYTPAYSYDGINLDVFALHGRITSFDCDRIYSGALDIKIISFDYELKRSYKVSRWDGHEIK